MLPIFIYCLVHFTYKMFYIRRAILYSQSFLVKFVKSVTRNDRSFHIKGYLRKVHYIEVNYFVIVFKYFVPASSTG